MTESTFTTPLHVEITDRTRQGRVEMRLLDGFGYWDEHLGHRVDVEVPADFCTDLASVPRLFWFFFPPLGRYSKAAVVHDYLYIKPDSLTREQCDRFFLNGMRVLGVSRVERRLLWLGVRIGGGPAWARYRNLPSTPAPV